MGGSGGIVLKKIKIFFSSKIDKNGVEDPKKKVSTILGIKIDILCVLLSFELEMVRQLQKACNFKGVLVQPDHVKFKGQKNTYKVNFYAKNGWNLLLGVFDPTFLKFWAKKNFEFFRKNFPLPPPNLTQVRVRYNYLLSM